MSRETGRGQEQTLQLPKNVQQIGNIDNVIKVYLEDYNGTYIRRILGSDTPCHGILIGKKQTDGKKTAIFVRGILQVDVIAQEQYWKYDWNKIYELIQKYFIEDGVQTEILGWAMSVEDKERMDISMLEKMHTNNFDGNMSIALILDRQEMHEQFYVYENNQFHSLGGYYVYYDKNKAMHNYVMENQTGPCVETEEIVRSNTMSCRTILKNRREMMQRKQTASILYVASTFLVMLVIVLGVTMMNNYDKMQEMQNTLGELSKSFINEEPGNSYQSGRNTAAAKSDYQGSAGTAAAKNDYQGSAGNAAAKSDYQGNIVPAMSDNIVTAQAEELKSQGEEASASPEKKDESPEKKDESPEEKTTSPDAKDESLEEKSATPEEKSATPEEKSAIPDIKDESPDEKSVSAGGKSDSSVSASSTSALSRLKYRIQPGDTLEAISLKMYHTVLMVDKICEYNNIEDGNQIVAGDVLILP